MDSLLFAAGLTSFGLGAAMTVFAWNIVRQNRRREDARKRGLTAATDGRNGAIPSATQPKRRRMNCTIQFYESAVAPPSSGARPGASRFAGPRTPAGSHSR